MPARALSLLASLGMRRLITLVLWACLVGIVTGYASATLVAEDKASSADTVRPKTRAAGEPRFGRVIPTVVDAVLLPASTASGIQRQRARVTATVRLRNTGNLPRPATATPTLIIDGRRVKTDPAASAAAGELLQRLPGRSTVRGDLRFETAGGITERLVKQRRAKLRIAGQTLQFKIRSP